MFSYMSQVCPGLPNRSSKVFFCDWDIPLSHPAGRRFLRLNYSHAWKKKQKQNKQTTPPPPPPKKTNPKNPKTKQNKTHIKKATPNNPKDNQILSCIEEEKKIMYLN